MRLTALGHAHGNGLADATRGRLCLVLFYDLASFRVCWCCGASLIRCWRRRRKLRRFKNKRARAQAHQVFGQRFRFGGRDYFIACVLKLWRKRQSISRRLPFNLTLGEQIGELGHHGIGRRNARIVKMLELRKAVRVARTGIGEVRSNADLAKENMSVINEILQDGISGSPAAFEVTAVALHANLHGVAGGTAVRPINILAGGGETTATARVGFACVESDRILPAKLFEVLANNPVKGPGKDKEKPEKYDRSPVQIGRAHV